jgi:transcriptional regulator with XRE-family HTH domain
LTILRLLRELRGMTGAELARQLKVSEAAVSLWERGLRSPNEGHSRALERAFRTSASVLLRDARDALRQ